MEITINKIMDDINYVLNSTNTEDKIYKLMRVVGQYNNEDVIAALSRICVVLKLRVNLMENKISKELV